MRSTAFAQSVLTHAAFFALLAYGLAPPSSLPKGDLGLAGSPRTRLVSFAIEMQAPAAAVRRILIAPEAKTAIPIPKIAREFPKELKHPAPRVVDGTAQKAVDEDRIQTTSATALPQPGTTELGALGRPGQGGLGDRPAEKLGDRNGSDRAEAAYLRSVHEKIQREIRDYVFYKKKQALFFLSIGRDGELSRLDLLESSGDARLDRTAWEAIKRAQPFPPREDAIDLRVPVVFRAKSF